VHQADAVQLVDNKQNLTQDGGLGLVVHIRQELQAVAERFALGCHEHDVEAVVVFVGLLKLHDVRVLQIGVLGDVEREVVERLHVGGPFGQPRTRRRLQVAQQLLL